MDFETQMLSRILSIKSEIFKHFFKEIHISDVTAIKSLNNLFL